MRDLVLRMKPSRSLGRFRTVFMDSQYKAAKTSARDGADRPPASGHRGETAKSTTEQLTGAARSLERRRSLGDPSFDCELQSSED